MPPGAFHMSWLCHVRPLAPAGQGLCFTLGSSLPVISWEALGLPLGPPGVSGTCTELACWPAGCICHAANLGWTSCCPSCPLALLGHVVGSEGPMPVACGGLQNGGHPPPAHPDPLQGPVPLRGRWCLPPACVSTVPSSAVGGL